MTLLKTIDIAGRPVGPGFSPLLLPDIGTFFNQDQNKALSIIGDLHRAGAEMIKGELLHDSNICLDDHTEELYFSTRRGVVLRERYRELIERKTLSLDAYEKIFAECTRLGLPFIVSVYDIVGADFAKQIGAAGLKIASSNIVHEPLIRYVSSLGLPTIIDTGKATLAEIARAVEWANREPRASIIVEYSPPPPPAPIHKQNLRVLNTFASAFSCLIGLSDHHAGPEMLFAATAMGCHILEKGVCDDDLPDDQDVAHALPVSRFSSVIETCRIIHAGLGDGRYPAIHDKKISRMCLIARHDIDVGTILTAETVDFAFPSKGVGVEHWSMVSNWRLNKPLASGTPITWSDIEPLAP